MNLERVKGRETREETEEVTCDDDEKIVEEIEEEAEEIDVLSTLEEAADVELMTELKRPVEKLSPRAEMKGRPRFPRPFPRVKGRPRPAEGVASSSLKRRE